MAPRTPAPTYVVLTLHQPPGCHADEVAQAVASCYDPLLAALERHPELPVALHLHGHLLDQLARRHEAFLLRLKQRVHSGQVEVLGGLFYGGPISLLPEADIRGQIAMAGEFWESFLGVLPQGIFLPHQAWAPELPRLLEDTGLLYGFLPREQALLSSAEQGAPLLGRLDRGGLSLYTFLFDATASAALDRVRPAESLASFAERASQGAGRLGHTGEGLVVAAESLVDGRHDAAGIEAFFAALQGNQALSIQLPSTLFAAARQAPTVTLCHGHHSPSARSPALRHALGAAPEGGCDPSRPASAHFVVETLFRRMLRASQRLREAIEQMEDEGREAEWSDVLATAQRHLFASQTPDVLCSERGALEPEQRQATLKEILAAERLLDALTGRLSDGADIEDVDLDADLTRDAFVTTPTQNIWVTAGRHGAIRSWEILSTGRNLIDGGTGQREALLAGPLPTEPGRPLPQATIDVPWQIADFMPGADAAEGAVVLDARLVTRFEEVGQGGIGIRKRVQPLPEGAGLRLSYTFETSDGPSEASIFGIEIPLALGSGAPALSMADGGFQTLEHEPIFVAKTKNILLRGGAGLLTCRLSSPCACELFLTAAHAPQAGSSLRLWLPWAQCAQLSVELVWEETHA